MITLSKLVAYVNELLEIYNVNDYCPNGLQVQGRENIHKIVTGVTACQALLSAAIAEKADAILVHHGYFWKNENPCITHLKYQRLKTLLQNDVSLLAYHLPLDIHPEYGNNAQLGKLLNITLTQRYMINDIELLNTGELPKPQQANEFIDYLTQKLNRSPIYISGSDKPIKTIAWCTGAAQNYIETAANLGVDAYLSGEISEQTVHIARESNIHFFAAGHHATERYGVVALGKHLADRFGLEHQFIDIDNPV